MSGLFRYNSNVTPTRRSTLSPFCVSTQDVTMDNSFTFGYRSPTSINLQGAAAAGTNGNGATGGSSPSQGRSLREYDEKVHALQKENFNLKLRLFFMEEKSPTGGGTGTGGTSKVGDDESLFKQNVDLKVENEELRKELQEKQDLLCQAAKAMELMEEAQRKSQEKNAMTVADLTQKINYLEEEIHNMERSTYSSQSQRTVITAQTIKQPDIELKAKISALENTIKENQMQMKKLSAEVSDAQNQLAERDAIIKQQKDQSNSLADRLTSINKVAVESESFSMDSDDICELKKQILAQKREIADKQCTVQDLEEKLAAKSRAHDKGCKTIQLLLIKTREMDAEIEQLKSKDGHTSSSSNIQAIDVNALRAELIRAQSDAEQANRWRQECAEVCSVLTSRLKELAGFLDSLLKHKDVLSVLAQDRHKAMRKAVDNSLDLSRSLSISGTGRFSLNEQSLLQTTSISEILNDSYFAGRYNPIDASRSSDGSNNKNSTIIDNLRAEVQRLKLELQQANAMETEKSLLCVSEVIRKERSVRNLTHHFELNSESEAWSEPDRKVSHERIGLVDAVKMNTHVRSPCSSKYKGANSSSDSDDNKDSRLAHKNSVLRLQEKILDLELQLSAKSDQLSRIQCEAMAIENGATEQQKRNEALTSDLDHFRQLNRSLQDALSELKEQSAQVERELMAKISANDKTIAAQSEHAESLKIKLENVNKEILKLREDHAHQIDAMISQENVKLELLKQQLTDKFAKDLEEQIKQHMEQVNRDLVSRIDYDEQVLRTDELEKRLGDSETLLQLMRDNEAEINGQIVEKDKTLRTLKRNLDEVTLQTSKAVLERTKFMNERDQFEKLNQELQEKCDNLMLEKSELHSKMAKLAHTNAQLHNKLVVNETQFQLTRSASQGNARYALTSPKSISCLGGAGSASSGGDQSGYTSDELKQRLENSSPDLGIESDGTGRSSGADAKTVRSPNGSKSHRSPKCDFNESLANILLEGDEDTDSVSLQPQPSTSPYKSPLKSSSSSAIPQTSLIIQHDCEKIDKENVELRRKLERTRRAFEKTWTQLRISNQRKEQIEKDIRQEIYKTHSVLKTVRSNIESTGVANKSSSSAVNPE